MMIHVGSTKPAKVEGTRDALHAIAGVDVRFRGFSLEPHDVTHLAPRMPLSVAEIIDGARIRARAIWKPQSFAVGLEGGLAQLPTGEWSLHSWAAVHNGRGGSCGAGPTLVLPPAVAQRVVAGEELGDVIDQLSAARIRGTRGAWGILTLDLIGRRDAFRLAVVAAFAPFYNGAAWSTGANELGLDSQLY